MKTKPGTIGFLRRIVEDIRLMTGFPVKGKIKPFIGNSKHEGMMDFEMRLELGKHYYDISGKGWMKDGPLAETYLQCTLFDKKNTGGMSDLPDGKLTDGTWHRITTAIIGSELISVYHGEKLAESDDATAKVIEELSKLPISGQVRLLREKTKKPPKDMTIRKDDIKVRRSRPDIMKKGGPMRDKRVRVDRKAKHKARLFEYVTQLE